MDPRWEQMTGLLIRSLELGLVKVPLGLVKVSQ